MSFAFEVFYKLLDRLLLGGGEVLGELGELIVNIRHDAVRRWAFKGIFYEAENPDAHQIGTAEGDGGIALVEGMEFDMVIVIDHFFDEGFFAIDEDYGDAAAIDAWLLMDLDYVAVLDLRGHTVAGDFDADGFAGFAIGVDVDRHIFKDEVLRHCAEPCADRLIHGDHAGLGGVQDDSVAAERGGGRILRQSGDRDTEVVGYLFEGGVVRSCAVFPFGN